MRSLPLLLISLLTAACSETQTDANQQPVSVTVDERMAGVPDPGFARALEPRAFEFPRDHAAHTDFATEWWYFTGNLQNSDKRRFGYQLTLFRIGLRPGPPADDSDWRANQIYMGHMAISDVATERHLSAERFSRAAAGLAGATIEPLRIWLGPWSIQSEEEDLFPLRLDAAASGMSLSLRLLDPDRPMVLQGDRGLSRKSAQAGNASYYYSYTRIPTVGEIRLADRRFELLGNSWFDREWSSSALAADQAGWDWFALQLDDGRDLMFYRMRGRNGQAQDFSRGVLVAEDGVASPLSNEQAELTPVRHWTSDAGTRYPVAWTLRVPSQHLDLQVNAVFDAQEMPLTVRYWEGAVTVEGSHRGVGYMELSGYAR